jgi:hypothetical protein
MRYNVLPCKCRYYYVQSTARPAIHLQFDISALVYSLMCC